MIIRQIYRVGWFILLDVLLISCTAIEGGGTFIPMATPTLNAIFIEGTATITVTGTITASSESLTAVTVTPNDDEALILETAVFRTIIYDDQLDPNWDIQASSDSVDYSRQHTSPVHSGNRSLSIATLPANESLFFRVQEDKYPREKTLAISFWISSESEPLVPESMTLSVTGSNTYPYWVDGDNSAGDPDDILTFSGARTYSLGIEQPIPSGSWVRVDVLLDNLVYDPDQDNQPVEDLDYEYITGFYLTNIGNSEQAIIIDDIELMMEQ